MAQKNRANMLTDIVSNIYNNLVNFITGQNAQDRFVNLLDSSPNILSDKDQANGYVGTSSANEMLSAYYCESITAANLFTKADTAILIPKKWYLVTNANGGTKKILVQSETVSTLFGGGFDAVIGEGGAYDINTGVFTAISGSGNASITPITVAGLTALQGAGTIATTTIYLVIDASPFVLAAQFKANNQNVTTATIMDNTYAGTVLYTASTGVSTGGRISDANGNVWNGCLPSIVTLGTGCLNNQFNALSIDNSLGNNCSRNIFTSTNREIVLGDNCKANTFGQESQSFTFANNLQFVTIEEGISGNDYTATPAYDFLYNNTYASTIFISGGINYHRYFDVANDRIVITDLATPANVTYIGGSGGTGDVVGPASAVDNNIAVFDTITGKLIKDGGATIASLLPVAAAANYRLTVSDGSGNRGNAGAITASRALKSDANGVPTHFDTATEPSLTELSYVKGVTSAIQAQLDAKASKTFVESISLQDGGTSIAATTYTIELYANYAYTINELKIISGAGTCTAALKINGTDVTSISAVAVSTTIATATSSGANTVAVGDKITLVTTSNSGLSNLQLTIKTTRI